MGPSESDDLFVFQQKAIDQIKKCFIKSKLVVLEGASCCGKTKVGEKLQISEYKKYRITGNIDYRFDNLGAFKHSTLFSSYRKVKKPIIDVVTIVSSFFGKESVVEGFSGLLDSLSSSDTEYIMKKLSAEKALLVIDHVEEIDHNSIKMIEYLENQIDKGILIDVKILLIVDSSRNLQSIKNFKWLEVKMGTITPEDLIYLGLSNEIAHYQSTPIPLLFACQHNHNNSIKEFHERKFKERMKLLNAATDRVILKTILMYSAVVNEKWVDVNSIRDYLWQNQIHDSFERMNFLSELNMIEFSDNKQHICLHAAFRELIESELINETDNERTYIYLDYLEKKAPFMYYEKYMNYVVIGNMELALKNAVLSFSQFMRKSGVSTVTNNLLKFIETVGGLDIHESLKHTFHNYIHSNYQKTFHLTDNFLNKLEKNPYAYSDEIIAELSCIRALSLARSINRSQNTRHIKDADINYLEKLLILLKDINLDLYTRVQEALINLCVDIINTSKKNYKEKAKNIYSELYNTYQKQIAKTSPKYVEFWQVKLGVLLSKINSVMSPNLSLNTVPVLQRAHLLFSQVKKEYPNFYLRTACNYAGACYWQGRYEEALSALDEAILFIENNNLTEAWGIIYQVYSMIAIIRNNGDKDILSMYQERIWLNENARNKMHEEFICISNYSVFLLSLKDQESTREAIEYLQSAINFIDIENKIIDDYDKYLLKTNLGVAMYLIGDKQSAIRLEKECLALIDKNEIKHLDLVQLKERHFLLIELYNNQDINKNSLSLLGENQEKNYKSGHDTRNYRRLSFFSNIEYWSN